jgi:hypothetical protein
MAVWQLSRGKIMTLWCSHCVWKLPIFLSFDPKKPPPKKKPIPYTSIPAQGKSPHIHNNNPLIIFIIIPQLDPINPIPSGNLT